jgi:hypothetical protein
MELMGIGTKGTVRTDIRPPLYLKTLVEKELFFQLVTTHPTVMIKILQSQMVTIILMLLLFSFAILFWV